MCLVGVSEPDSIKQLWVRPRRNGWKEGIQQWKTLLTWKFVHEPVLKSNVISSKLPLLDHSHISSCVCAFVHACVCVCFSDYKVLSYSVSTALCIKYYLVPLIHKWAWEATHSSPKVTKHTPCLWFPWQMLYSLLMPPIWKVFRHLRDKYVSPLLFSKNLTWLLS